MAIRWFLKIDGIPGDSTSVDHKGEIDVLSFSWGVSNSGSASHGGGAASGKVIASDLQIATNLGSGLPGLFLACATGEHFKKATLMGVQSAGKGKGVTSLKVTMEDMLVTSVVNRDGPDETSDLLFTLGFSKIEVSYTPTTSSGAAGQPITTAFDLKSNKKA